MKEIYLIKNHGILCPADEESQEIIKVVPSGKIIKVKYSFSRSLPNHRRFFKFVTILFGMQEHFSQAKHLRKWLIMKAGYYTTITAPNGYQWFEADSMRFDKMDEVTFQKVFSASIDVFLEAFGEKFSRDEILRIVEFS